MNEKLNKLLLKILPKWVTPKQAKIAVGLAIITINAAAIYIIFLIVKKIIADYKKKKEKLNTENNGNTATF